MKPKRTAPATLVPVGALAVACVWSTPLAAWASTTPPATPRPQACKPGPTSIAGNRYRLFCGPASANVNAGGRSLSFRGGQCSKTSAYFVVNIGAAALGQVTTPARPYFGITVGKLPGGAVMGGRPAGSDGAYHGVDVVFNSGGTRYLVLDGTVTLSGGRSAGRFSGKLLTRGSASGTFRC